MLRKLFEALTQKKRVIVEMNLLNLCDYPFFL